MNFTREELKRLAFVKYLFDLGKRQSHQHEPLRSCSLLLFHDATELFLDTIAHHFSIPQKSSGFMDYWKNLRSQFPPVGLPQERDFEKMNKARVSLKHHGLHPSGSELEDFRNAVQRFFEDVTMAAFGESFESVSLAEFISHETARSLVKEAISAKESGGLYNVTVRTAEAFDLLLHQASTAKDVDSRHNLLAFIRLDSAPHVFRGDHGPSDPRAHLFFEQTKKAIESLQETVKIMALGIDYRRYSRFHALTPEVVTFVGGAKKVFDRHRGRQPEISASDADFCIEFVISSAFELQERSFIYPAYSYK